MNECPTSRANQDLKHLAIAHFAVQASSAIPTPQDKQ
jgi:hypothetical protein